MSHPYQTPPTMERMAREFAGWIAGLFRVSVVIKMDDGRGNTCTVEVDRRPQSDPTGDTPR